LLVDVGGNGVGGDAAESADVDGLNLAVVEQLIEQAAPDAEAAGRLRRL
jgi:hypothetical protein